MVAEQVRATLDAVAPQKPAAAPVVNPNANTDAAPAVKGERVPSWGARTIRYLNAAATLSGGDASEAERRKAAEAIAEIDRQTRAAADWQKGEEDKEAGDIITAAGLSRKAQQRLHSTLSGPAGEFLLPKPFLAQVFTIIEEYGVARRVFQSVPMVSKDLDLKNVTTKPSATWTGEGANFTESDLVLSEQKLATSKLSVITSWTTEQEEDQAIALLPVYAQNVGESFAQKEDEAAFIGDGTSTYGGFTGLTKYAGATAFTMGSGDLAIADITEADLRSVLTGLTEAKRMGGQWFMHYDVWNHITGLENTAGYRLVQPDLTGQAVQRLLGYPVVLVEAMPNPSGDQASEVFAVFGNPSRFLMGQRRGMSVDTSREAVLSNSSGAVTYNAYQADGQLLRMSERIGFQVPTAYQSAIGLLKAAGS
jgi:HK97 family phage major capsid protein